jgi:hypothetical protein
MASFKQYYRSIFATFGFPLSERMGVPADAIAAAGKRLGVRIPTALRDYYAVVGRERRFNVCLNRFLPPKEWFVDGNQLIFLEENQNVFWWGVSVRDPRADDPSVAQRPTDEDQGCWDRPDHRRCSVFVAGMLHYHAASGGFEFSGWSDGPLHPRYRFAAAGWQYHGTVRRMRAYSRPGQVVCLFPPSDYLPEWMGNRTVLVAGKTARDLREAAAALGVSIR